MRLGSFCKGQPRDLVSDDWNGLLRRVTLTIALMLAAASLTFVPLGFVRVNEPEPAPAAACSGDCVPRSQLVAAQKLAAKRLRGWRRANRKVVRIRAALRVQVKLGGSGLEAAFLCIHRGEGAWNDATGNGYYGGLQMDRGFMASYGGTFLRRLGPANNWTPAMQVAVAEIAYYSGRGFYPWPNTARACGLL